MRLLVAGLCGAAVGFEREISEKGAGLRTHILICLGACLFSLVGLRMSEELHAGDPLRILQGMLLGVGFIAGGVIFTRRGSVRGLTTAAGLWVLSGIGLASGMGYYFLAIFGTFLTVTIIAWLKHIERRIHKNRNGQSPPASPPLDAGAAPPP